MHRRIRPAFAALAFFAASTSFAEEPAAHQTLRRAINLPTVTFEGTMSVTYWHPRATIAEEVHVVFNPPNRTRWEFLRPDGRIDRAMMTDGDANQFQIVSPRRSFSGEAPKSTAKIITAEQEWNLLLENYDVTLGPDDSVAGQPCELVLLKPRTDGKPMEKIWVDKSTGVILEIRRIQPKTGSAMVSRFVKFSSWTPSDPHAPVIDMNPDAAPKEQHPLRPDYLSKEEMDSDTRLSTPVPPRLRDGFVFESADFMRVKGGTVHQVRYTDGLCVLSLFQTEKPTRSPSRSKGDALDRDGMLEFSSWSQHGHHYTLMGDVSRDLLQDISLSFKKP